MNQSRVQQLTLPDQTRALKKFCWFRWGAERRVKRAQTREQGALSAPGEFMPTFEMKSEKSTLNQPY